MLAMELRLSSFRDWNVCNCNFSLCYASRVGATNLEVFVSHKYIAQSNSHVNLKRNRILIKHNQEYVASSSSTDAYNVERQLCLLSYPSFKCIGVVQEDISGVVPLNCFKKDAVCAIRCL